MVACTEKARVLDCEAAYYFPQGMDRCGASSGEEDTDTDADTDHDVDADPHTALAFGKEPRNLVFHIRSGDIFKRKKAYAEYGQVYAERESWGLGRAGTFSGASGGGRPGSL